MSRGRCPMPGFTIAAEPLHRPPARTSVRQFSSVPLANEGERTIAILSRPGDRPCVALTCFAGSRPTTRFFFHRPEIGPVLEAIRVARDPSFTGGVVPCGRVAMKGGASIGIYAQRPTGKLPAVLLVHEGPDGAQLGRGSNVYGPELDALEAACRELLTMTSNDRTQGP